MPAPKGSEDDTAFEEGVGFTDVVKRPTASAKELSPAEFAHGRELMVAKLEAVRPRFVLFTYKRAAEAVFGRFAGNGFAGLRLAEAEVFVMPGPYESTTTAARTLRELSLRLRAFGCFSALYKPGHLDRLRAGERS